MAQNNILDDFDFDPDAYTKSGNEATDSVVVGRFYSLFEAQMAAMRLDQEDIPSFITNEHTHTIMQHLQTIVQLCVHPKDREQALAILAELALESEPLRTNTGADRKVVVFLLVVIGFILIYLLVAAFLSR
jgi:Putative prokaryotic signal transducing protein